MNGRMYRVDLHGGNHIEARLLKAKRHAPCASEKVNTNRSHESPINYKAGRLPAIWSANLIYSAEEVDRFSRWAKKTC